MRLAFRVSTNALAMRQVGGTRVEGSPACHVGRTHSGADPKGCCAQQNYNILRQHATNLVICAKCMYNQGRDVKVSGQSDVVFRK